MLNKSVHSAQDTEETAKETTTWIERALHILVLWNLAVAYPALDAVSGAPEFFHAHFSSRADLFVLVLALTLLAPALLVLLGILARIPGERTGTWFHLVLLGILLFILILPTTRAMGFDTLNAVLFALISAVILAEGYRRQKIIRSFVSFMAPVILLSPALFLLNSNVSRAYFTDEKEIALPSLKSETPVILLVFDELPLVSLMDLNNNIDPVRFPNFSRLQASSHWFRNATTVAEFTETAMTALLTGRYPSEWLPVNYAFYRQNLFTFLGGSYQFRVHEALTRLCPPFLLKESQENPALADRMKLILLDISAIYLHLVLPEQYRQFLPPVDNRWADYWGLEEKLGVQRPRGELFEAFVQSIHPSDKPAFYYFHSFLPHLPYEYFPTGTRYPHRSFGMYGMEGLSMKGWGTEEDPLPRALQRQLLQVAFVDRLVGNLLDRLEQTGLFDPALIIVTADHGFCIEGGKLTRVGCESQVLPIPLFIKLPHQNRGVISDRNVEIIDVFPSIADVLDEQIPWKVDGVSVFDEGVPERSKKIRLDGLNKTRRRVHLPPHNRSMYRVIERNARWLGSNQPLAELFRTIDSFGAVGRETFRFQTIPDSDIELHHADMYEDVNPASGLIPALVSGRIRNQGGNRTWVGIGVNGTVQAVTRTFPSGGRAQGFSALVPESALRPGKNEISIVIVNPGEIQRNGH